MNETSETKTVKRSGAFPFFRWLFSWRMVRRALIGLIGLATLIGLLITEENWRSKRAWDNYRHEWEAKGEKFDWQSCVPPAVPDDENFFTAPIFTDIANRKIAITPYGNDGGPDIRQEAGRSGYVLYRVQLTDLEAWQSYYRNPTNFHAVTELVMSNGTYSGQVKTNYLHHAVDEFPVAPQPQTPAKDVLLALSKYDSAVEELRQASQRPYANIPLNYENGIYSASSLIPVLAELKRCTQLLQLRAVAELSDGQNEKALADMRLLFYLGDSLRSSPFLISYLVRIAIVSIDIQPVWEGLAKHEWSDAQLIALDAELAKQDFLADYGSTMRGERALAIFSFENQRRTREVISYLDDGSEITNKMTLMPNAYFYQNELSFARMYEQWILPLVDTNTRVISPEFFRQIDAAIRAKLKHYSPYTIQARMTAPALTSAAKHVALIQAEVDLARTACALERYRLAHGEYPETLDALAPQFIAQVPHDIINGQPLKYRREANGRFVLYSVGWNEKDDGGQAALNKNGVIEREKGDWIWQYPVK